MAPHKTFLDFFMDFGITLVTTMTSASVGHVVTSMSTKHAYDKLSDLHSWHTKTLLPLKSVAKVGRAAKCCPAVDAPSTQLRLRAALCAASLNSSEHSSATARHRPAPRTCASLAWTAGMLIPCHATRSNPAATQVHAPRLAEPSARRSPTCDKMWPTCTCCTCAFGCDASNEAEAIWSLVQPQLTVPMPSLPKAEHNHSV